MAAPVFVICSKLGPESLELTLHYAAKAKRSKRTVLEPVRKNGVTAIGSSRLL